MPNIWTHILFGEEILKKANIQISQQYKNVFKLGAQGPDPFFYYNFWPWKKDKSITKIGGKIHKEKCSEFLLEMIEQVKIKNDPLLKYYLLGFLSHHILDRNTHPYIIYKSGEEGHKHQVLETTIDTILAKEYLGIDTWKTPVFKEINVGKNLPDSINSLIYYLLEKVHKIEQPNLKQLFNEAYRQMKKALTLLYDPSGVKNVVFKDLISPFSHKKRFPDKDYLNLQNDIWYHPANKEEKSTENFYDLLRKAEAEGIIIFKAIEDYLNDKKDIMDVSKLLDNISYETGKNCDDKYELIYFDPIV